METSKLFKNRLFAHLNKECANTSYTKKDILVWGLIGAAVFLLIYGFLPLNVTYDRWLMNGYVENDATQHYAGWLGFRHSAWTLPLGTIEQFGGTVLTYTDSIPIVSIFFKVLDAVLPDTFQFFGLYVFLCFILQGISSGLLLSLFSKNRTITNLGVILFCLSPIMIERAFRHTALASHWLILFSLYFYFKSRQTGKMSLWNCLIPVLAMGVHPYFLPMVFGLTFANVVELSIRDKRQFLKSAIILAAALTATVLFGYLIGALGTSSSLGGTGFGHYSMNLNAPVNPVSVSDIRWSAFLSPLPLTLGNIDGFNYLGLGTLLLLLLLTVSLITNRKRFKELLKNNLVLIVLSVGFWGFAVSNVVTLGGNVLFTYPLPEKLLNFAAIFRASSRIFYPVYYLLLLSGICGLSLLSNSNWKKVLLFAVVLLQLADLSPALVTKRKSFEKETVEAKYQAGEFTGSEFWNGVVTSCRRIKMLNAVYYEHKLAAFAEKHGLAPDLLISVSHYQGTTDLDDLFRSNVNEITLGNLDRTAAYVTTEETLLPLLVATNEGIEIFKEGPYFVIASPDLELPGKAVDKGEYAGFTAYDLTDTQWTNGILGDPERGVILFKYYDSLYQIISSSREILCNGEVYEITELAYDADWIHVVVDRDAVGCGYPNKLTFR